MVGYNKTNPTYNRRRYNYKRSRKTKLLPGLAVSQQWINIARKAYVMGKKAVGLLNSELKAYDTSGVGTAIPSTGVVQALTGAMIRGTAENNRIGGSILLKSLYDNMALSWNPDANQTTTTSVRCLIVRDLNDANGTALTLANVLNSTAAGAAIVSPLNLDNVERFKVIYDKVFHLDYNQRNKEIKLFHTFGMDKDIHGVRTIGQHCTWDSSDVIEKGHLYFMIVSDATANVPAFTWAHRVRYTDN